MTASSTFHRLIDAALKADLSKNEYKIFLALLRQTIGYGKASDPLTPARLSRISGIRKDRLEKATLGVLETGIFKRRKHAYYVHQYQMNTDFLPNNGTPLFSPSLPKNRNPTQETETKPTKRVHTITTNTSFNQHNHTAAPTQSESQACRSGELVKPPNVDLSTYENLLPALLRLKNPHAQNVLAILSVAISEHSIKTTPTRLGFGLIKQANAGLLDTACLKIKQQQQQKAQSNQDYMAKVLRAAERNGLRQQAKLLGISLEQHARNLNQEHWLE